MSPGETRPVEYTYGKTKFIGRLAFDEKAGAGALASSFFRRPSDSTNTRASARCAWRSWVTWRWPRT
jgi:hypothetical protein